jgi:2-polyprenyl-3-methyl-5-hydroxy-6-metoxy-1,4-benzoquinol methylase
MNAEKKTWTREAIEAFLRREKPAYQRIELPHGLSTGGDDRSDVADLIFPADLTGKTVLDVGCFLGSFCHEAHRRGAKRVVGVDVDEDRLRQARTIAEIKGLPIEFKLLDINEQDPGEQFDVVILLNVLHHVRNPITVLDRLAHATREQLILEIAGTESEKPARLLKRMGANWLVRRALKNLPIIVVGRDGKSGRKREQKFFFTAPALRHFLIQQRALFGRIDEIASPFKERFVLKCHRRRVADMVLIAGPTGAGKSTLMERLGQAQPEPMASALGVGADAHWPQLHPTLLMKSKQLSYDKLLYHYDLLRPWGRDARHHQFDEGLAVLGCCDRVKAITLLARREELIARLRRELAQDAKPGSRQANRLQAVIDLYSHPDRLKQHLERWLKFCEDQGAELFFADTTQEPRLIEREAWMRLAD